MRIALMIASCLLASSLAAQTPAATTAKPPPAPTPGSIASHPDWPKAKAADVDSIEHILAALYGSISGPAHQPRDWVRLRSICVPDARLIPVRPTANAADVLMLSVEDYITRSGTRMEEVGFFEHSTHNEIAEFGDIVHVFSTYESRRSLDDAKPFARGINSIQLLKDGGRYWVVNIFWDAERPDTPIPAKYQ